MRRLLSRRAALLAALAVAGSALIGGCLKSTEPQPSALQLAGTWSYTGEQTGPVRETLAGTLTISGESGTSFQGRLELVGTNTQTGATRALTGLVSGAQSGAVVDFDATLDATMRRHVGQIIADTISGTWVGDATSGTMASGTFRVEREAR
jgi:hypothetical protein